MSGLVPGNTGWLPVEEVDRAESENGLTVEGTIGEEGMVSGGSGLGWSGVCVGCGE